MLAAALAAVVALPALAPADGAAATRSQVRAAQQARLRPFSSCGSLIRYARRHALQTVEAQGIPMRPSVARPLTPAPQEQTTGAPGQPMAVSAPGSAGDAAPDFSTTNVQEGGVDEPDVVKTDGTRIFAIAGSKLHAIDARSNPPRLLGSLALEGSDHQLLRYRDRLLVLSAGDFSPSPAPSPSSFAPQYQAAATLLAEVDVRDPAAMRVLRTQRVEGVHVSARLNGGTARVVVSSPPDVIDDLEGPPPQSEGAALARNRRAIRRSRLRGWMPSSVLEDRRAGRRRPRAVAACRAVRRPRVFSGLGMLTVLTVDMAKGLPVVDSDAVLSDGHIVYGSTRSLYVATARWFDPDAGPSALPSRMTTVVHAFDATARDTTRYRASGAVPGHLLNQFSLSEHEGVLRVASTETPTWFGEAPRRLSESFVTVLDERDRVLVPVGQVGGLGRGERIYAVRFLGDAGYVVTFRQVDPLYTLDLSTPRRPAVRGELKIRGYSAYLHPLGRDLLLGIGRDATEEGQDRGVQLSLFDVSDLRNPTRLHQRTLGTGGTSEVEYDHHAFLHWPPTRLAVLPLQQYDDRGRSSSAAVGFRVGREGIEEVGRVAHEADGQRVLIRRSVVVGDRLFTVSDRGAMASRLDTLAGEAWVPFPD